MDATSYRDRLTDMPASGDPAAGWYLRHLRAVNGPQTPAEGGILDLIAAWLGYADAHQQTFGSGIGEDFVLGPAWARAGAAVRDLLQADLGRLDAGTLDGAICRTMEDEGFDPSTI